jgi:hypothetical protein
MYLKLFLISILHSPMVFAQTEENEILRVAALRAKFEQKLEVLVFPNPSSEDRVWIKSEEGGVYQLYSLSGDLVTAGEMTGETIELTDLFPGTYILQVEKDGRVSRSKLVVL